MNRKPLSKEAIAALKKVAINTTDLDVFMLAMSLIGVNMRRGLPPPVWQPFNRGITPFKFQVTWKELT